MSDALLFKLTPNQTRAQLKPNLNQSTHQSAHTYRL
jgi:hypothetical protein